MTIFWVLLLSVISGICYRLGGWGDEGRKKFPQLPKWLFDTKARDIGCGLCTIGSFFVLGINVVWWQGLIASILTIPLMLGTLSTYWDFLFGYDNFWFHGFMVGVAFFLFAIITGHWIGFVIRCFLLAILIGGWSILIGKDWLEEFGRGFALPVTIFLMI